MSSSQPSPPPLTAVPVRRLLAPQWCSFPTPLHAPVFLPPFSLLSPPDYRVLILISKTFPIFCSNPPRVTFLCLFLMGLPIVQKLCQLNYGRQRGFVPLNWPPACSAPTGPDHKLTCLRPRSRNDGLSLGFETGHSAPPWPRLRERVWDLSRSSQPG
jgi:hypothetical protein